MESLGSYHWKVEADAEWWEKKIKENSLFKKFHDKVAPLAIENSWKCVFGDNSETVVATSPNVVGCGDDHVSLNPEFKKFRDKGVPLALENSWKRVFGDDSESVVAKSPDVVDCGDDHVSLNSLMFAYGVLYLSVKDGFIECGSDLFFFAATKILDDRSREGFMLMESHADRVSWLTYHLREKK